MVSNIKSFSVGLIVFGNVHYHSFYTMAVYIEACM